MQAEGWTDERVSALKTLWNDGLSASQIAAELGGVTRNAVIAKVHRLGLNGRARNPKPGPRSGAPRMARAMTNRLFDQAKAGAIMMPEPEPPPIEDAEIPVAQRRTILELTGTTCRWPVGTPGAPDFFFCGAGSADFPLRPYCPHHTRVACNHQPRRRA